LDAGSGTGLLTLAVQDAGFNARSIVSLDLSTKCLHILKDEFAKRNKRYEKAAAVQGDVLKMPFADGTFEAVVMCGVLEYTPLEQGLQEAARVLKQRSPLVLLPVRPSFVGSILEVLYSFKILEMADVSSAAAPYFNLIANDRFSGNRADRLVEEHFDLRKEMTRLPLIIAHRGASRYAPENTLAAIRLAVETGADGIEIDLRLAKDGVPVVIHDADLLRTGGISKKVRHLTSLELADIDVGTWFDFKYPRRAGRPFAGETVPLLDDVLQLLVDLKGLLYLELKCDERDAKPLVTAVCERIGQSSLLPRIIVKSFALDAIRQVKQHTPTVQTAALFGPDMRHLFKRRRHLVDLARQCRADQLSVHRSLVSRGLVHAAASAKMPVLVWTVDDPRWMNKAVKLKIAALITNDPSRLLKR
jgi:glycerophosphoryl diester phosphodiesterase